MDRVAAAIAEHIPLVAVPSIPEIRLHMVVDADQLNWLPPGITPYWAYVWAGGAAVAHHLLAHPEIVRGRRVIDLGAGSGIVGIAAALAGASRVRAAEIDAMGRVAIALNTAANGVSVELQPADLLGGAPPSDIDIILAGDMFYDTGLAARVAPFLAHCREAGLDVIVGDPGRGLLPRRNLKLLAEYGEGSLEDDRDGPTTPAAVYALG